MTASGVLAGHLAARALRRAGVPWVTGVSGESFLPLLDGLRREAIPFIPLVQEGSAAFMAGAYARATGRPAVLAVTRGPGLANATIGLHEAMQGGAPMVVIVGQVDTRVRGRSVLQEIEIPEMLRTVVKDAHEVGRADRVAPAISAALRKATLGRPGPVVVSVPADLFYARVPNTDPPISDAAVPSVLSDTDAAEVVDRIRRSRRALFVVGGCCSGGRCAGLLAEIAERTGAGTVGGHAFLDALPSAHPHWLGSSTIRSAAPLKRALATADLVIFVDHWPGDRVSQGYAPFAGDVIAIGTDQDRAWDEYLSIRTYDADPVTALERVRAGIGASLDGSDARQAWVASTRAELEAGRGAVFASARERSRGVPMPDVLDALDACMPPGATLVSDTGSYNDWITRYMRFPAGRRYVGTLSGSMGFGIPAAIAAQLAFPETRTVALTGDGAFLMTGMELATIARMRLPVTVIVFRNGVWGSIALHQDREFPGQRFGIDLPAVSFTTIAQACGVPATEVTSREALDVALGQALAAEGPYLLEVPTDPELVSPASYESGEI